MKKLLIVESPAKCKKIAGFLGAGWTVKATMGHIRALKEELDAIGFSATGTPSWIPTYEAIQTKRDAIAALRAAAAGAEVYLGSDDDREGEAIAWHTCAILGLDPETTPRVTFHEITAPALKAAVAAPRTIDLNKFSAQQARTMLDMLIGFTLSPCLWRGVGFKPGLSAGRCQTPALRIIYDKDRDIEAHTMAVTWRIAATSEYDLTWKATTEYDGDAAAQNILQQLTVKPQTLTVRERSERLSTSQPPKPFITSTLQQEASSRLGMNPKDTMRYAQTLYESGHITYMRTDNAVLSREAIDAAADVVRGRWGEEYLGATEEDNSSQKKKKAPAKKAAKNKNNGEAETEKPEAQAAHEGIRPTHMDVTELGDVTDKENRLYELIWKRTIQCVMAPEQRDVVKLTAVPTPVPDLLTVTTEWDQTRFAGWRILDHEKKDDADVAAAATAFEARKALVKDGTVPWTAFTVAETRSSPPARYTEAALIRELEHRGIGRPSTYATLVETVLERGYVEKANIAAQPVALRGFELKAGAKAPKETKRTEKAGGEKDKLRTTALGRTVMEYLLGTFGDMIDYDFTAAMEAQLDAVAKGERTYDTVLGETWDRYRDRYNTVMGAPRADGTQAKKTAGNTAKRVEFGDGYKVIVGRKGPLFVLEREGEKTRFADVPGHLSLQTATRADAEAAFAAKTNGGGTNKPPANDGSDTGTEELDGTPIIRKKGPYGFYACWGDIKVNCKENEPLTDLVPKLRAKASGDAVNHDVGPFCIRKGPYGLYMFRKSVGAKKPAFVSIPDATDWAALTVEGAEQLYNTSLKAKAGNNKNKK